MRFNSGLLQVAAESGEGSIDGRIRVEVVNMSILAKINNAEAAKRAARNGTPYVPWNRAEVLEPSFLDRLPRLGLVTPKGWKRLDSWTVSDYKAAINADIDDVLTHAKVTLGFAFVDDLCVVYTPLDEAHEPLKAEW